MRGSGKRRCNSMSDKGRRIFGFRNEIPILFDCADSVDVPLHIVDADGSPAMCSLLIRDEKNRVYPHPARRLAPDFFFHHKFIDRLASISRSLQVGIAFAQREAPSTCRRIGIRRREGKEVVPLEIRLKRWVHMAEQG